MFCYNHTAENGYNRTFLENVIIEHNATKKSNDSRSYTNPLQLDSLKKIAIMPNMYKRKVCEASH